MELQEQRAQIFYDQHKWKDARAEFEKLAATLQDPDNPHRQHALLRAAQARVQLKGFALAGFVSVDHRPEVDAERMLRSGADLSLRQKRIGHAHRRRAAGRRSIPSSKWSEEALMMVGNYYWVELDRSKAINYYQRVLDNFPAGKYAFFCEWRVAWIAYLDRQPYADDKLTAFLRKYPTSANAPDALYWLGRNAERSGNPGHARAYFRTDADRFPQTYFGRAAAVRLDKLGPGDEDAPDFLAAIPPPPALRPFDEPVPDAAQDRWVRAQALAHHCVRRVRRARTEVRLLRHRLAAPAVRSRAGRLRSGTFRRRHVLRPPDRSEFRFAKILGRPVNVWKTLYPLPYEASLRREAARNDFDPMIAAGLIRQESTFQADAVSHANAIGLMQVLPKTGKLLAKQLKVRYVKTKLFEPEYNLELGMLYIAGLLRADRARRSTRSPPSTPAKTASPRGAPNATTKKSPNWWSPFRSPRHATTCRSSCATPKSIA